MALLSSLDMKPPSCTHVVRRPKARFTRPERREGSGCNSLLGRASGHPCTGDRLVGSEAAGFGPNEAGSLPVKFTRVFDCLPIASE